jgi:hypothetical protein
VANFPDSADHPEGQRRSVQFRPQGAGQPIKDRGNNAAVARGGSAGLFTITWQDKPSGFAGAQINVGNGLANSIRVTSYNESTGVLSMTCFADGTTAAVAADIAANALNIVWVNAFFAGPLQKKI